MCDADRSVQQVNKERSSVVVERSSFQSSTPLLFYLSPPPHSSRFFKVPVTDDVTTLKISTAVKLTKRNIMSWWSGPSDGHRRAVESVRGGVLWQERRENSAQ